MIEFVIYEKDMMKKTWFLNKIGSTKILWTEGMKDVMRFKSFDEALVFGNGNLNIKTPWKIGEVKE